MAASKEGDLGRERWQGGRQQGRSSGRKKDGECGGQRGRRWVMEAADLAALSFPFFTGGQRKGVREWEVGVGWSSWSATSLGFSGIGPYMGSKWMDSYMGSKWTDSYMGCEWTALSLS